MAPVADYIADKSAAQAVSLEARRPHIDRVLDRPLVNAGDTDAGVLGGLGPANIDGEYGGHECSVGAAVHRVERVAAASPRPMGDEAQLHSEVRRKHMRMQPARREGEHG